MHAADHRVDFVKRADYRAGAACHFHEEKLVCTLDCNLHEIHTRERLPTPVIFVLPGVTTVIELDSLVLQLLSDGHAFGIPYPKLFRHRLEGFTGRRGYMVYRGDNEISRRLEPYELVRLVVRFDLPAFRIVERDSH